MRYEKVIVFGPSGDVGDVAALEASKRGAKVWLAMRDPSKTISGIPDHEQDGNFIRVKADLSKPETVKQAVQQSGAKAAYVYLVFVDNGLQGAFEAMKEAGIEYVVFLSSFSIKPGDDVRRVSEDDFVPYTHAQAEIQLEDLGIAHTTLRPGALASNTYKMSLDESKTPCEIFVNGEGTRTVDNVVPIDIGRVAGAVLVDRPSTELKHIIYLLGPQLCTELEMCNTVRDLSSKQYKVVQKSHEDWIKAMQANGAPEGIIQYFTSAARADYDSSLYSGSLPKEGAANIKKYSGYEPTSFEDYVKHHNKD